jgi:hypothetical protein
MPEKADGEPRRLSILTNAVLVARSQTRISEASTVQAYAAPSRVSLDSPDKDDSALPTKSLPSPAILRGGSSQPRTASRTLGQKASRRHSAHRIEHLRYRGALASP